MSRLNALPESLQASLNQRSLLKVIAGLNNFDKSSVEKIAWAAGRGGADLLDVACDPSLVEIAREASKLPVCVSAVDPELFPPAVSAGASMIEIGNFDSFYSQGRFFDAAEVLLLTRQTRELLPEVVLSVTVPHTLPFGEQSQLAIDLILSGADLIQTEGGTSAEPLSPGIQGLIEKAVPTLSATKMISNALIDSQANVPIITASGLSEVTVPMAIAVGASGVGVGSLVNRLDNQLEMLAAIRSLRESLQVKITSTL